MIGIAPDTVIERGAPPITEQQIGMIQDDLAVLVDHLSGRPRGAGMAAPTPAELKIALISAARFLTAQPDVITRDPAMLGQLFAELTTLNGLAAPATVRSIRLTRAFVNGSVGAGTSAAVLDEARRLLRWAWVTAVFGVCIFLCAIMLLVHVDQGRRVVQQLETVGQVYQVAKSNLNVARVAAGGGIRGGDAETDCPFGLSETGVSRPSTDNAMSGQEHALCDELQASRERIYIVRHELQVWNAISQRLSLVSPLSWLAPEPQPLRLLQQAQWESTELRTSIMITTMTGFVMPMLLGLLGSCVNVYREIDDQIRKATLETRQSVHGTLRMLMGAILGGMLGAIWTNGQPVRLEGVSLSLGALAFFIGFSVEIVFRVVDTVVKAVAGRLGDRPA